MKISPQPLDFKSRTGIQAAWLEGHMLYLQERPAEDAYGKNKKQASTA